ncbi:hypothetical protein PG988_001792 [Apiospora saccharicola]
MAPANIEPNRVETIVSEKRQPWKEHWSVLASSKPTGDGTSHGFEKGEQVLMDGNIGVLKSEDEEEVDP